MHPVSLPALFEYQPTGRDLTLGAVQRDTAAYTRYTISYRSDDLKIFGILNIPKGEGPFPVLFLNHGYIDTAVYTNSRGLKREQDYLARRGFAVLHADYRCHAQSDCPAGNRITQRLGYVKDVINAVAAVKNSGDPRLSSTAFGMLGHSMGGGVTQRLAVSQPDLIQAAVPYAPVSMDEAESFERYTAHQCHRRFTNPNFRYMVARSQDCAPGTRRVEVSQPKGRRNPGQSPRGPTNR